MRKFFAGIMAALFLFVGLLITVSVRAETPTPTPSPRETATKAIVTADEFYGAVSDDPTFCLLADSYGDFILDCPDGVSPTNDVAGYFTKSGIYHSLSEPYTVVLNWDRPGLDGPIDCGLSIILRISGMHGKITCADDTSSEFYIGRILLPSPTPDPDDMP